MAISIMRVNGQPKGSFASISKAEIEMLLSDVAKTNPASLKRLSEDREMKKQQIENLRQLLAYASQAEKEGLASDPNNRQELDSIRAEIIAVNYDREINKDKGPMPPFGFITDDEVKAYWGEKQKFGQFDPTARTTREAEFNDFFNAKLEVLKASSPEMKDREVSEEERTQARDIFAKIRIYKAEFDRKSVSGELSKAFIDKANLQVKLQQAQFLARLYSEKIAEQTKVTDSEIAKYIALHPELDPSPKRARAQEILDRAKAGENFAVLANTFSEDPGNKATSDQGAGGLYKDVPKGQMVAPFEQAALALQPGQISPELVETDFGFHIIKLERSLKPKKAKAAETYDVRHILISTGIKDPENPTARESPVKEYVRTKLETEKEKQILDKIVAENNIRVPDDFTVPEVAAEPTTKTAKVAPVKKKRALRKRR